MTKEQITQARTLLEAADVAVGHAQRIIAEFVDLDDPEERELIRVSGVHQQVGYLIDDLRKLDGRPDA